jgi:hypothetical protein
MRHLKKVISTGRRRPVQHKAGRHDMTNEQFSMTNLQSSLTADFGRLDCELVIEKWPLAIGMTI